MFLLRICILSLLVNLLTVIGGASAESTGQLRVITSIKPIHSLVAAVMAGAGQPDLIMDGSNSPHGYALKPSKAKLLEKADIVFWVGPALETFLQKPVQTISSSAISVELIKTEGLKILPFREFYQDDHSDSGDAIDHGNIDPHIWLDPQNAKMMVRAISAVLIKTNPKNAGVFQKNTHKLLMHLEELAIQTTSLLKPVTGQSFITHHDGYQYFEKRFGLNSKGALITNPEILPGIGHALKIRARLKDLGKSCLFTEHQFPQKFVTVITENTNTKIALLDPMGAAIDPSPELYFLLIEQMSHTFYDCLSSLIKK